jgi:hypothetical protein
VCVYICIYIYIYLCVCMCVCVLTDFHENRYEYHAITGNFVFLNSLPPIINIKYELLRWAKHYVTKFCVAIDTRGICNVVFRWSRFKRM